MTPQSRRTALLLLLLPACSGEIGQGLEAGPVDGPVEGPVDGPVEVTLRDVGPPDRFLPDLTSADVGSQDSTHAPSCTDGLKNNTETDIDCGGSCPKCVNGKSCKVAADCVSGYCDGAKTCKPKPPSCTDKLKNQDETDVDCGGSCPKCVNGKSCKVAADCSSAYCDALGSCQVKPTCGGGSVYDCVVRADKPVSYYQYLSVHTLYDVVGGRHGQTVGPVGAKAFASFPATSQDNSPNFTTASYITVPDHSAFSISTTGTLTLEFWLRPSTLLYSFSASTDAAHKYLYALGKGDAADYEYGVRFYSSDAVANRANAISAYVWNTTGGLGSGATSVTGLSSTTEWVHFVAIYTTIGPHGPDTTYNNFNAAAYPGTIKLYRNGVLQSSGYMSQFGVKPQNASSPLQLGRRGSSDGVITYAGAVGKLALYNKVLTEQQIVAHYKTAFLK